MQSQLQKLGFNLPFKIYLKMSLTYVTPKGIICGVSNALWAETIHVGLNILIKYLHAVINDSGSLTRAKFGADS